MYSLMDILWILSGQFLYLEVGGILSIAAVGSGDDGPLVVDGATAEVEATLVTERNLVGELSLYSGITANNLVLGMELSPGKEDYKS